MKITGPDYNTVRYLIRERVEALDKERGIGELSVKGCLTKCNRAIGERNALARLIIEGGTESSIEDVGLALHLELDACQSRERGAESSVDANPRIRTAQVQVHPPLRRSHTTDCSNPGFEPDFVV